MKHWALVVALALWSCASEVRSAAPDGTSSDDAVSGGDDAAHSDVASGEDVPGAPEDAEVPAEDVAEAPQDVPTAEDALGGSCDCETATSIVWLQRASHGSCSPPAPGKVREICKDAHTQEFETGDTFGVKGCKFEVSC